MIDNHAAAELDRLRNLEKFLEHQLEQIRRQIRELEEREAQARRRHHYGYDD